MQSNFIAKVQVGDKSRSPETGKIDPTVTQAGKHRNIREIKDLEDWLKRVGLSYHFRHKFRHGNTVYSLKNAKDVSALKVVSQNLMHANLSATDGVYGILAEIDVKESIIRLSHSTHLESRENNEELILLIKQLLQKLDIS